MQDISTQRSLSAAKCTVRISSRQSIVFHIRICYTYVYVLLRNMFVVQTGEHWLWLIIQIWPHSWISSPHVHFTVVGMSHLAWCSVMYGAVVMWCFPSGLCNAVWLSSGPSCAWVGRSGERELLPAHYPGNQETVSFRIKVGKWLEICPCSSPCVTSSWSVVSIRSFI